MDNTTLIIVVALGLGAAYMISRQAASSSSGGGLLGGMQFGSWIPALQETVLD